MSDIVSANEAAHRFGLSEKTVRRWIVAGKLKADKSRRAYRVSLSEVATVSGQAKANNRGPTPDSGQTADTGSAPPTADSMSAMSGISELVALVERLHDEVRQYAETAATWQTRAELLAHQLAAAENKIEMLEAPEPEPAPNPFPSPLPPTPNAAPWWRRWVPWLGTAGLLIVVVGSSCGASSSVKHAEMCSAAKRQMDQYATQALRQTVPEAAPPAWTGIDSLLNVIGRTCCWSLWP